MLPKKNKISRKIFPSNKESHKTWNGEVLRVLCYRTPVDEKNLLVAVVLSKKHYTTTIARNSFKRMVFSMISEHMNDLKDMTNRKIVIYPIQHISKISNTQIRSDIEKFVYSATQQ